MTRKQHYDAALGRFVTDHGSVKDLLFIAIPALALIAASFLVAWHFVEPAPPATLVLTTGAPGGVYYQLAERYRGILARDGVTLVAHPSAGSLENLRRLADPDADPAVGFAQGGIAPPDGAEIVALAAIYYEPLWIFYRGNLELTRIAELAGKRIAVGAEGSGTRVLALQLLRINGADGADTTLLPLGDQAALAALRAGTVDTAFFVAAPDAPIVQQLLKTDGIRVMELVNAEAITRHYPYLSVVTLPRGAVDLAADIPAHDLELLATTANLIARRDLHPALAYLLLAAATEIHSHPGLLCRAGEFPRPLEDRIPQSDEAKRYFASGTPLLRRYVPFWLANFIERMVVLLIPFFALLLPALKAAPAVLQWRIKARLFRWYSALKELETEVSANQDSSRLEEFHARLAAIQRGVSQTPVPNSFSDYLYHLKSHIEVTRRAIDTMIANHPRRQ